MISPVLKSLFAFFLFFLSSLNQSLCFDVNYTDYQKFKSENESKKLKLVRSHLMKINKPAVKTFQSPDGDIIDCVSLHEQPAFDHPLLRGQRPLDPPQRPKEYGEPIPWGDVSEEDDTLLIFQQLWSIDNNEFCPEGTIPVRRTREEEVLRATSIRRFGRKIRRVRRDSSSDGHEHAIGYVTGEDYYGAKASINVWAPRVQYEYEFSLSQIWVIAGTFGYDLNTIEAGWQVNPELYGDNHPRFFIYWTSDAYQTTGCYNLLCSGFVQTNNKIAMGAAITPISSYDGGQFDISLLIWKDPKHGNWWLEFGNGILVGYWPSFLFTHLADRANMVQFGGEVVNMKSFGAHTSTQMGSGHFAGEGFGKSAYFRNLQIVDWANKLVPTPNLRVLADHPNCYNVLRGINGIWGNYLYFGGPGRNSMCP